MPPSSRAELRPVDAGNLATLTAALAEALAGGPPLIPYAAAPLPLPPHDPASVPRDLALVVGTSGSTGVAKLAMLTAGSLVASADATHERLGGPGTWLLALPAGHIAGLQVLIRSLRAGRAPVVLDRTSSFSPSAFAEAAARVAAEPGPRYTALVPTQIGRLLATGEGVAALRRFDAVLAGGAALSPALRASATAAGVRVVATYGMSETAGGCVYDGVPLRDTVVALADDGRIELSGPTLASGYLGQPDATAFTMRSGRRCFATDDLGEFADDGRLRVLGRRDDVIITGGYKVHPRVVEDAAAGLPGVRAAVAVAVPDPEWGMAITLALVPAPPAPPPLPGEPALPSETPPPGESALPSEPGGSFAWSDPARVREALRGELAPYALPRTVLVLPALPERGPGKPDRAAIAALARERAER
ncbi:MAG: AMP-binding protein [Tetrasphaera jenkinsii]|uniref:AMP-binding protein n=1 Tax=Nostocoides jenkinsii TaxID=330834 RepID=UPI000A012F11|nr:AMP-binding protein [Tetrasphaera jenkinsii]MCI1262772.1 AMP-binding protein [Tetrasphaera jenkinsii]